MVRTPSSSHKIQKTEKQKYCMTLKNTRQVKITLSHYTCILYCIKIAAKMSNKSNVS